MILKTRSESRISVAESRNRGFETQGEIALSSFGKDIYKSSVRLWRISEREGDVFIVR